VIASPASRPVLEAARGTPAASRTKALTDPWLWAAGAGRSHRWVWSRGRMEEILPGPDRAVFSCGIARNQDEMLDLFDRVFLLHIDGATQQARLDCHDALHPLGRSEAGRREILDARCFLAVFARAWRAGGRAAADRRRDDRDL
jgi:hypothetical protein